MKNLRRNGFISFFAFIGTFAAAYFLGQTELSSLWRTILVATLGALSAGVGAVMAAATAPKD